MTSWPTVLSTLLAGASLGADDTAWAMAEIMSGSASPVQVAGFAVALRAKGETPEEITGLVRAMLAAAQPLVVDGPAVDTCGTGGDRAATVNISTMAALVVRGAGSRVVKHGNRAASSACGSADLLQELGVVVDLPPEGVARCIAAADIGFCFAPVFHPALRHSSVARRELGVPTVFNILGPLTNPAQPSAQAVGVADERLAAVMAKVLADRGASALVFRGTDGLDELSVSAPSRVWVVARRPGPRGRGRPARPRHPDRRRWVPCAAPTPRTTPAVTRRLLDGEPGPVRDAVLLNAAAAIVAVDGTGPGPVTAALAAAPAARRRVAGLRRRRPAPCRRG